MRDASGPQQGFQLSRNCRLTRSAQFKAVFSQHSKVSNRYFRILVQHRQDSPDSRLGIIVSRRVSRKAVNRNRIRRQLREAFRLKRHNLKKMDLVVIAHRSCEDTVNKELRRQIIKLFNKLES